MKRYLTFLLLVCGHHEVWPQKIVAVALQDTLPNIQLNFSFNGDPQTKSLHDLRGKVILFDFWNVTCTSCIEAFPKLEALQRQFAQDIAIITVTRDSREKVVSLFNKNKDYKTQLPVITNDTILAKYFTVRQPHHAWLDKNGKVIAIGHSYNATEKNIRRAIAGQPLNIPLLTQIRNFNTNIPLALNPSVKSSTLFRQYHMLSGFQNGILMDGGAVKDSVTKQIVWRSFYNKSIISLLKFAFGNFKGVENPYGGIYDTGRVVLNVKDPNRFIPPEAVEQRDVWRFDNFYCYEIGVLPKNAHLLATYMQTDLQRYFGIRVVPQTRKVQVLELGIKPAANLLKEIQQGFGLIEEDKKEYRLLNYSVLELARFLNKLKLSTKQVVVEPGAVIRLNLNLAKKNLTEERFMVYLNSLGITLLETERKEAFLYVEDIP